MKIDDTLFRLLENDTSADEGFVFKVTTPADGNDKLLRQLLLRFDGSTDVLTPDRQWLEVHQRNPACALASVFIDCDISNDSTNCAISNFDFDLNRQRNPLSFPSTVYDRLLSIGFES